MTDGGGYVELTDATMTGGVSGREPLAPPVASSRVATSTGPSTDARIVHVGRTACDAYPRCDFEGKGEALREHMRTCPKSEAGDIYRVLTWRKR